nr:MAG TPA: hypothetical protein [Caudoviricetes sp.]
MPYYYLLTMFIIPYCCNIVNRKTMLITHNKHG